MSDLKASIAVRRAGFDLDVDFDARSGSTIVLLGPNGSGKTTLLKAIAGLIRSDRALVTCGARTWEDSSAGIALHPSKRDLGMVFQSLALFPWLSVEDNVRFGAPKISGADVSRHLVELGLSDLSARRAGDLSGGEAQMVALARALARRPEVLLLDEPLSSLDVRNRSRARRAVNDALQRFEGVRLVVTHDPLEAGALADEVLILEAGRIVQRGTWSEVGVRPGSEFTARFAGVNLFRGSLRAAGEVQRVVFDGGELVVSSELPADSEVLATVHPHSITLSSHPTSTSARNAFEGTVGEVHRWGARLRLTINGRVPLIAEVTPQALSELDLVSGSRVFATVKATEIDVYPA